MHLLRSFTSLTVAALCAASLAVPIAAQQGRTTRDAEVRAVPDGNIIATVESGTVWRTGTARGGFTTVTLEGWIDASRLGAKRDSFPATVGGSGTLRLRADASLNARILGVLQAGAGIRIVERKGDWARIRRDGWVLSSALAAQSAARPAPAVATTPTPAVPAPRPAETTAVPPPAPPVVEYRDGALRATATVPLSLAPGTRAIGMLDSGAVVEPVVRDRGWVRVRIEAWVPENSLVPADSSYAASLTAADLRLDPEGLRGRTVRWLVQVVGLQTADPLRRALQPDEPYLLAMGPSGENAILYVAVPPHLLEEARRLTPLAQVMITARVRNGRSQPTGAPVLDLLSFIKQ
ncbi:MAG: SH3 domain-containing protein [Gemmatimonadetes bacterium]|jgi:hypothetical protein|nr:SH3 domain-containing protein [Gemmatimonadota bacterium]MBP7548971.1 SH3 domain-containing protein [Gemmatimonadaceae bacterium]